MRELGKHKAPKSFVELVLKSMARQRLSLRTAATQTGMSAAFLSRILTGNRGLPSDSTILRLADVLGISPPEKFLVEAGRVPSGRPEVVRLFRATGDLTTQEIKQVLDVVKQIREQRGNRH